ncbi:unnamed protein product [Ambrosiozyma monospora]|uniref:Unnamed protein product n=1 Tax=Ambrosiozyma monospora TaxID=43982 RepID=A0ACB5T557_AMBMO|nr:unnamed protein product [Ambrosiozyma monospora]
MLSRQVKLESIETMGPPDPPSKRHQPDPIGKKLATEMSEDEVYEFLRQMPLLITQLVFKQHIKDLEFQK